MGANPSMLRLARQHKGFHQIEAARRLGVDQSLLSRMENGLVEVRDDFAAKAARVYALPAAFFEQTDPIFGAPVSVHPMWRRKADVSAREMDTIVAELNIRLMHLRRLLQATEVSHIADVPRLDVDDYGDPEKIAALVRAHWKIPRGPIEDLTVIVEQAGVLVAHSPLGQTSISGVTFAAPGLPPLIVLNGDQPADRMRFTLAHELGHLVMHRFPTPEMEQEANDFASALLMPAVDMRPYFNGRRIDLRLLAAMKPEWKVSMQALLMRARSTGAVTDNQAQYLWKQINFRRLRLREPPELDFPAEVPTVISAMIRLHLDVLNYTAAELATMLKIHPSDLHNLYSIQTTERPRLKVVK